MEGLWQELGAQREPGGQCLQRLTKRYQGFPFRCDNFSQAPIHLFLTPGRELHMSIWQNNERMVELIR